jgi:hypothetical protein
MKILERYDRFLVQYGIPAVIGIFAVIIAWFALHSQANNALITFCLLILAVIIMAAPVGINAARSGPWDK